MLDIRSSLASIRKRFIDTFSSRSNTTGSLGKATDGSQWTAINGTLEVVSGKAKATTIPTEASAGSDYPMAVVKMPTANNTIKVADTLQGSAAALWVQSSTDWWMVDVESTFNTIPGNAVYGAVGSNYGAVGSNYGVVGSNYGIDGTNYGVTSYNYTATGSNYGVDGTNYGVTGTNYGLVLGANYSTNSSYYVFNYVTGYNLNYGTTKNSSSNYGRNYGATGTNYSVYAPANPVNRSYKAITSYGATGYNVSTTYGTSYNFVSNPIYTSYYYSTVTGYVLVGYSYYYGATGNNYGGVGNNYGPVGTNYGSTYSFPTYGAVGNNYGAVGSNYGSVGTNYGSVGTNYGQTSTNATTYAYAQYLKIRQSSASVVSTITSALISATQTISSIAVQVSGNTITAKAYSDNFVTQIGSDLVHTATGAVVTTQFGISVSPSAYQQSDIIGSSVEITRN